MATRYLTLTLKTFMNYGYLVFDLKFENVVVSIMVLDEYHIVLGLCYMEFRSNFLLI